MSWGDYSPSFLWSVVLIAGRFPHPALEKISQADQVFYLSHKNAVTGDKIAKFARHLVSPLKSLQSLPANLYLHHCPFCVTVCSTGAYGTGPHITTVCTRTSVNNEGQLFPSPTYSIEPKMLSVSCVVV